MFSLGGVYRGSSVLISGVAGTGKTTFSATFADAACARGERCLFFVFEESADQVCRNARSIGLDLQRHLQTGRLSFQAARPSLYGLEMHLARMHRDLDRFAPGLVVIDPISAFRGPGAEVHATLLRMVDLLKSRGITGVFTSLRGENGLLDTSDQELSSVMDTWIKLGDLEANGEMNRVLHVIKARGMSHSHQVREYRMTDTGIQLIEPYIGSEGVLTGTARMTQVAREQSERLRRTQDAERRRRDLIRRRESVERQIAEMLAALESEEEEARRLLGEHDAREGLLEADRAEIAARRGAAQ